jgi:hypothetical protein
LFQKCHIAKVRASEPGESLGIKELQKRMSVRRRTTGLSPAIISEFDCRKRTVPF